MWRPERTVQISAWALKASAIFCGLVVAALAICAVLFFAEYRKQIAILEIDQQFQLLSVSQAIEADLESVVSDLLILSNGNAVSTALEDRAESALRAMAEQFQLVAQQKQTFGQIRYLDESGMEVVRVNYQEPPKSESRPSEASASIVPEAELQNKGDRYYFRNSISLDRGEIYVSPFDLNVERGMIEEPLKPTVRLGTPVFDKSDRKRGAVIINYLGQSLLGKLDQEEGRQAGRLMLLNEDGYWLKSPNPKQEWGFMYGKHDLRFPQQFPVVWRSVTQRTAGQFASAQGMFTFRTIVPARDASSRGHDRIPQTRWKLISWVTPQHLSAISTNILTQLLQMLSGVAILLAVVSVVLGRSLAHQQLAGEKLKEQEHLAAIGTAMTVLSHESRNALQRSQAGLEMLARRLTDDEDTRHLFQEVQEAQYSLRDLYERVKDWSAPLQPQPEPIDLAQLVQDVWEHLRASRRPDDVLEIDPGMQHVTCRVDRRMFQQLFRNLLENSLYAANPAKILVRTEIHSPGVRIWIRDNGSGLGAEQQARLFEPFYTTGMRGSGLGMAICRRIMEAHGGTISARNVPPPHTGTEIELELPVAIP